MRILLTNDDGIAADGFEALKRIAYALSDDVWIAAPETEHSGASRKLTLTEPIRVRRIDAKTFAIGGTPTDCVMLGIQDLMPSPPDLVLSGVNRGQNLAEDVTFSGTVAGALQGMALGVPSVALSQALHLFHDEVVANYAPSETYAPGIIARLLEAGWPAGVVMNLNFPDAPEGVVPEVEVTRQGFRDQHHMHAEKRTDLRGRDYYWMGFRALSQNPEPGTDLHAIAAGRISVTPLHIDLTHAETIHALKGVLGGSPPKLKAPSA